MLRRIVTILSALLLLTSISLADARLIQGTYRNYALGFSVKIPQGLRAVAGNQAGPERGVGITLRSGGTIVVFAEHNSFGWQSPEEGIRYEITRETEACRSSSKPSSSNYVTSPMRVGDFDSGQQLMGAQVEFICAERFVRVILVFRPGGGPIYWFRLTTTVAHKTEGNYLDSLAHSFTLIPWR